MANRKHRVTSFAYHVSTFCIIVGGGIWFRLLQRSQMMVAVRQASAAKDFQLVMQLQHADLTNELWVWAMIAALIVATEVNAPILRDLQNNGWALAIKSRKLSAYVQVVTLLLLGLASFRQPIVTLRWLGLALIVVIPLVTWLHWRMAQKYRAFYSDPNNYLIAR